MNRYLFSKDQQELMENMQVPFAVYQFLDKRVVTLALSDGFCRLFGYKDRFQAYHDMDNDMYKDTHPDDAARIADAAFRFATEGGEYDTIYRTRDHENGGYKVVHAKGTHVHMDNGARLAHVWYTDEGGYNGEPTGQESGLNRALNDALREQSIIQSSYYDYLTGLPSMTYFFQLAEAGKNAIVREGAQAVFLFMDLSGMKFFNTKYSFGAGDELLRSFAKILSRTFGNENCCRIAGDHFAVYTREDGIEDILQQLFLEARDMNGGNSLPVRVGIYPGRLEDVPVSTACDRAKFACDSLRDTYGSRFSYYDKDLKMDAERRMLILSSLDKAIENRWIQAYYQPIVRAVNGRVCDEEALARWIDPERGFLSPADFIPYLEDAGVIYKLDLCILEQVLEKMERLKAAGLYLVPQSINLSRSDFYACDIVEEIRSRVDDAGIERKKITIEITESTIGGDFDYIKEQIERFRALGFPVWMDDFGSGYSSLDVLQSVEFDLIKFDMSFMKRLDEGEKAKIILSELMKMATALGVDTVCEGVETQEQVRFLQEIGCSKLQGYYFCKPIPLQQILERYKTGVQIGFENPKESGYFESMGRINLHDLAAIASEDSHVLKDFFNTLPVGIVEVIGDSVQFVRSNQTYRDFLERFFDVDLSKQPGNPQEDVHPTHGLGFLEFVKSCCRGEKSRGFLEERMPDGSVVGSFIRKIGTNPVTGKTAFAAAVLSVKKGDRGATYAGIARALAADYHSLYYVDLSTEQYIEYSSPVGGEQLAEEAHGEKFFDVVRSEAYERLYPADVEGFLTEFNRENILFELGRQGVFSTAYRLMKEGKPVYASMKVMRMDQQGDHLIIGVSIIDAQMKKREEANLLRKERDVAERIMALTGDYLSLYTVDTETGHYFQFSASDEYERLGFAKRGEDFFHQGLLDGRRSVAPEDLPLYEERFNRETVLKEIREKGIYQHHYRLMMNGKPIHVSLRMAAVKESNGNKLVAGVRAWKTRK